jgi:hypothetical protein
MSFQAFKASIDTLALSKAIAALYVVNMPITTNNLPQEHH